MSNAMNRLLWWHWLLIGLGASLILFLIIFFAVIKPRNEEAARVQTEAQGLEDGGGTPAKVAEKKTELTKKKAETVSINQQWAIQSAVYMPPIDFNKDLLGSYEKVDNIGVYHINGKAYGVKDLPTVWGRWITYWYTSQWQDGIVPITGFPIEAFSPDPNEISSLKAISFPQTKPWEVEVVAKNFDAAMNHLKRFNRIQRHGMPVVDKVTVAGQSPDLHLKYTLQLFVIPPTTPPPADPMISGAGGGGAAAASGGGVGMGGSGGMGMGASGGGGMMASPPGGGSKGRTGM
jgi:hypothetical protein